MFSNTELVFAIDLFLLKKQHGVHGFFSKYYCMIKFVWKKCVACFYLYKIFIILISNLIILPTQSL